MKKQSNTLFTTFSKAALANLTMEIKETLATDLKLPVKKTFTAADMWNIQRKKKCIILRRFSF